MTSNNYMSLSILLTLSVVLVFSYQVVGSSRNFVKEERVSAPFNGICTAAASVLRGFRCEELHVTTKDGYILSVSRINKGGGGKPVYMQHGLYVDGMSWFNNGPTENLPTILASRGYDVFVNNLRGTQFSRRNTRFNIFTPKYWDWSFDELAQYDLTAVVGLVYQKTGKKTHYVGHSMGTIIALISMSERRVTDKLKSVVLLSPIAYLSHINVPPGFFGGVSSLNGTGENSTIGEPRTLPFPSFGGTNCCIRMSAFAKFGMNGFQPTSVQNNMHFAQEKSNIPCIVVAAKGKVAKYDYFIGNMAKYGQLTAPVYNLRNIPNSMPLFLSYGGQDTLADPKDVQTLLRDLQAHDKDKLKVQLVKKYAHGDFIMAYNAKDIVYTEVLSFFQRFG